MAGRVVDTLYKDDGEIARRLGIPSGEFAALAALWERQGFPRKDPQVGMRYFPAVRAWLDQRNGLREHAAVQPDGEEHPDREPNRRRARA